MCSIWIMKISLKEYFAVLTVFTVALGISFAASDSRLVFWGIPIIMICMAISFMIHWAVFIPSFLIRSDKFFNTIGILAFLLSLFLSIQLTNIITIQELNLSSSLLACLVTIWTLRLRLFLFSRITKDGEGKRFRDFKV